MPATTSLPSYSSDYLAGLDDAQLIELLIRDEDRVPRNVVDELASRGDSAVAALESRFASPDAFSPDVTDGAWWLRLHAAMILGLVPTAKAGAALVQWIRRLDEAGDEDMEEWLAAYWPALLANKPGAELEALRNLSADRGLGWFARANAIEALVATAERLGPAALEAELEWVARLAADEREDWDTRVSAGGLLLDFPRPAHRELLEFLAQCQDGLGPMFGRSDVEEAYGAGRDRPQWRRFADPWQFYAPEDIEARQRRWAEERASEPPGPLPVDDLAGREPEAPYVRAAPKTGRNDPCPCGSGKKYKRCCLNASAEYAAEPEELLVWRRVRRALDGLPPTMFRFVVDVYGEAALNDAWAEFNLRSEEAPDFDPESPFIPVFMPWFFHIWEPDVDTEIEDESLRGCSPTTEFLRRRGRRLEPVLQRYLRGCLEAPFSFHEILDIEPGRAFRARDVLTGEERRVLERSATEPMQRGDILFAQLVEVDGIVMMEAGSPVLLPPADKIEVMGLREMTGPQPQTTSPRERLLVFDDEIREVYLCLASRTLDPSPPEMRNTDGELIVPHRLVFDIDSPDAAFHALEHLSVTEPEEELLAAAELDANGALERVSVTWSKPGNARHASWESTVLGRIDIRGGRLIGEVNSAERAAELRRLVEEALGERARHRATEIQSLESALDEADDGAPQPDLEAAGDLAGLPEVEAQIRQLTAAHYDAWVTEKLPALGGRTPLEAMADPEGREKVEALVTQLERRGGPMTVDPAIVRRLRERLGLMRSSDGASDDADE